MNTFLEGFTSHISNKDHGFHLVDKNLEITRFCSFEDLLKRSLSIAHSLQKRGLKKDDYAILMYTPGIEFIASLLAVQIVGAIPVPTYPPFSKAGFLRLLSIKSKLNIKHTLVDDQINKLILVQSTLKNQFHYFFIKALHKDPSLDSENSGYFSNLSVINTDDILTEEENISDFKVEDQNIALIQFTSGSVSEPKGVMLTFDNIMSNIKAIHNRMKINKDSRIFAWVPQYHDMGLVAGVLTSLYTGCNLYIMSPFDFIKRPLLWLKALDKFRITHTGGPNFSYDLCVKKITEEEMNPLDLSCLQVLINGAEPVKHSTMKNFIDKFSPCGLKPTALVPAYGMAEASLLVTSNNDHNPLGVSFDKESLKTNVLKLNSSEDSVFLVSNGKVVDEHEVVIWNEEKKSLCNDLEIGEILISGNSVTSGYINSPESPLIMIKTNKNQEIKCLRTGDLGFLYENNLYVTGRKKDLIIHHGKNYYPQDIEYIAETSSSEIRRGCSAAFLDETTEDIILVIETYHPTNGEEINQKICEEIKENVSTALDVILRKIILIYPSSISKTTSGKIQRNQVKKQYENQELRRVYTYE